MTQVEDPLPHDDALSTPATIIPEYAAVVGSIPQLSNTDPLLEEAILQAFRLRDEIEANLDRLSPSQLRALTEHDAALYKHVKSAGVDIEKWRYLFLGDDLRWWWYIDQSPIIRDGEVMLDQGIVTWQIVVAMILFVLGLIIMLITTQRLWVNGMDALGTLNLAGQLLIGGGLITDRGRELSMDIALNVAGAFAWGLSLIGLTGRKDKDRFPLARHERRQYGRGLLYASMVFVGIATAIILLLPTASRILHNRGVDALRDNDLNTARFYLETAVELQPDIPLFSKPDTASSLVQLGDLYLEVGNVDSATESFRRAINEDPRIVLAHHRLARIYINQGEFTQAIPLLDQAVTLLTRYIDGDIELPLSMDVAKQELFLSLVTRAYGYISMGEVRVALGDLRRADGLIAIDLRDNNDEAQLFVNADNKDNPPPGAIRPTEMHVLLLRVYRHFYAEDCNDSILERADEQRDLIREIGINEGQSMQRSWLEDASRPLRCDDPPPPPR